MQNIIKKFRNSISGIIWPSAKSVCVDTCVAFVTTAILILLTTGWSAIIDTIVEWVTALF
jgi:preprotein translocase subunit SecE